MTKAAASRTSARKPTAPPRVRCRLRTIDDVKVEIARIYREGKGGKRPVGDVSKLANVLSIMGRLIEGADIEERIAALERAAGKRTK
jgi:hypothetical protein